VSVKIDNALLSKFPSADGRQAWQLQRRFAGCISYALRRVRGWRVDKLFISHPPLLPSRDREGAGALVVEPGR